MNIIQQEILNELTEILENHCYNMDILRPKDKSKKKNAVLNCLKIAVINSHLSLGDLRECIDSIQRDEFISLDCLEKGGNLFKSIQNPRWEQFARELFAQRSVGLGTPNAASGEGELFLVFSSKKIKKIRAANNKNDLWINGKNAELKGEYARISGWKGGKTFLNDTLTVCKDFSLKPNISKRGNPAVELEKEIHLSYWRNELSKLFIGEQKDFVGKWLSCIDNQNHDNSLERIFKANYFQQNSLKKEIAKILFAYMVENQNFEKFIILGNGENIKVVPGQVEKFEQKLENGEIQLGNDYFRINQNYPIGWYIS